MDIQIKEETEDPLLEEQHTEKYFLKSKIDIKHDFPTCDDKADKAFYQQLAKCESVSSLSDIKIKEEIEDKCTRYESKTSQEFVFVKCEPQFSDVEDCDPNSTSTSTTEESSDSFPSNNKQYAHCELISTLHDEKNCFLSGTSEDQNQNSGDQNQNSRDQNQISEDLNQITDGAFKCSVCNKQFKRRQYLVRHIRLHVDDRHQFEKFVFVKCEIQSSDVDDADPSTSREDLNKSSTKQTSFNTYSDIKQYVNCESVSTTSCISENQTKNSGDHNQNNENTNQNSENTNQNSENTNQNSENQNQNSENQNQNSDSIYTCTVCNKHFTRREYLVRHIRLHAGLKKYNCSDCSKQFTRKENLVRHMKTHTGVKEFNCSVCYKLFSRKEDLVRHMKFHSGVKEFHCSVCNKQFSQKGNLTTHMNLHSGEKVYECTVCDKKYFLKDSLKFHLKTHN